MAKKKVAIAGQSNGKKVRIDVAGAPGMAKARIASPAIQKTIPAPYMEQATVKIKNKQGKVGAPRR